MRLFALALLLCFSLCVIACSREANFRSDAPLSKEEAELALGGFPFPQSAHSIYFFTAAHESQSFEQYIRFSVKTRDLQSALNDLIAWNNGQHSRSLPYPEQDLESVDFPQPSAEFEPLPWWNPDEIEEGYFRGHPDAYALQMFVDRKNNQIFVYQSE